VTNGVEPHPADAEATSFGEVKSIENSCKALWESVRRAAESITRLREEKRELQGNVERLERELQQVRHEVMQLKRQVGEQGSAGSMAFAGGEREALSAKVKELIAKLDAYL